MNKEVKKELNEIMRKNDWESIYNIDWHYLSKHKSLSEDFMREFQDNINWYWISYNQKLSNNFIQEFKNKLMLTGMLSELMISQDFYNELKYPKKVFRHELIDLS